MNQAVDDINPGEPAPQQGTPAEISTELRTCFNKQRQAYLSGPTPDSKQRKKDLLALKRMLSENMEQIVESINLDYGNRSRHETLFAEVISVMDGINDAVKHLKKWMKPQRRDIDTTLYPGAKNRVIPQPLGVVGLIIPWNFPVNLSFSQLTGAFAAGNRAMNLLNQLAPYATTANDVPVAQADYADTYTLADAAAVSTVLDQLGPRGWPVFTYLLGVKAA